MKLKVAVKNDTIKSFVDSGVLNIKNESAFPVLAGGAVRAFINNETPNDLDLFLIGDGELKPLVLKALDERYKRIFTCPDGYLYSFETPFGKLQLITPVLYESIDALMNTFDLSPCKAAFDGEHVYLEKGFIRDVKKKVCRLHNLTYPLATMNRIYKYKGYGYSILEAQSEFLNLVSTGEFTDEQMYRRYID